MGFFKKIFPKPKSVLKSPITLIKAKPKDKIKDFLASPKALAKGDIGGALNYAARAGGSLQDAKEAAELKARDQRRATARNAPFTAAQDRLEQSQARAIPTMGLGNNAYLPRQINYQPMGLGSGPGIRQAALGAVTQPFAQPNWGMPQFDQRLLSTSVPLQGGAIDNPYNLTGTTPQLPYMGLGGFRGLGMMR